MTKTQAKILLKALYDKGVLGKLNSVLSDCIEEMESIASDFEETRDSIEPYENKYDLTEKQQERYDWFDELCNDIEELRDSLDTMQGELCDFEDRFYERD